MGIVNKDLILEFEKEILDKGDELARAWVFRICAGDKSNFWIKYRDDIVGKNAAAKDVINSQVKLLVESEKKRYQDENIEGVDPGTMWDIVNGVWWPSIQDVDVALIDHPNDPKLASMRGVALKTVFANDGKIKIKKTDRTFSPIKGYFTPLYNAYKKVMIQILNEPSYSPFAVFTGSFGGGNGYTRFRADEQKEILSKLFTTEQAAKVWWISQFGNNPSLGRPLLTGSRLNSYLGYFNMMIGWMGGDNALNTRGITAAEQKSFKTFPFDSNVFEFNDTKTSHEALSLGCSVAAIQAQYKWLQSQKTGANADFYKGWFDRFFTNPKSLVNMLIIINERVHINGQGEFKYSPKFDARWKAMGGALASSFKLNIGE
tara:strand:- start:5444 stop:6565 length:1122 start_codon:yes stop_codon:yes gene_type:complete